MADSWNLSLIFIGIFLLIVIIYLVVIFLCYRYKKFIFAPYTPPSLPNAYQPLINVTPLTPEEQKEKQEAYTRPPP